MIIEIAIILILIILTCILVIPFNIFLNLKIKGVSFSGYFKLTWIRLRLYQKEFPDDKPKKEKKEDKKQEFDIRKIPRIISLLYESSPHLIRIFKAFLKSTSFDNFYFKLKMGLGSPYDTAIISGYLYAIFSLINIIPQACFQLEPDLLNERIEAGVNLQIKIRLLWIVIELLRAVTKKPVRNLIGEMRKMRG
ncbi:MAG: DUF2953 domain-containing protein [Methanobacterium sp.]